MNPKLPSKDVVDFVLNEGRNSTSFLTLYSGFQYFQKEIRGHKGQIAYLKSTTAWVGASDPICSDDSILEELILAFFQEAKKNKKTAILLPVSQPISDIIRRMNLFSIQIGSEPWFRLNLHTTKPTTPKQLLLKGAIVESFDPAKIDSREYMEIENVTNSWLNDRKMPALGFLNRLEPWVHLTHKKYFRVIFNGHQVGYLAAVPTRKNKAWYLVDLIRLPNAPTGTTELLILEAMKQLEAGGAREVTLGMSPLICLNEEEKKVHPRAYRLMDFAFNRMSLFYNFKSLYQYKEKFNPNTWEPAYLVASTPSLSLMTYYSLFRVLLPHGPFSILSSFFFGLMRKLNPKTLFRKLFSNQIALRAMPRDIFEFLFRVKVTLTLIASNLIFFFAANKDGGELRDRFVVNYSYQWNNLIDNGISLQSLEMLVVPSFLHWNYLHLFTNLAVLIVFVSLLELLAGSTLVTIVYIAGVIFSNPLTSAIIISFLSFLSPQANSDFKQTLDVGSSLGIFSCLAVFAYLLKNTKTFLAIVAVGVAIVSFYQRDLLVLNHLTAIAIGLALVTYLIPKELP